MLKQTALSLLAGLALAVTASAQTVTHSSSPNLAILPDNGCVDDTNGTGGGGVTDAILIPETTAGLTDVNVRVEFTHTWRSDLQMALTYTGGGGTVVLANNHGNSANSDNYFATFDSEAATPCGDASMCGSTAVGGGPCQTAPGPTCQPNQPLTAFNTLTAPGTFTLAICDRVGQDLGTLTLWEVTATGPGLPVELMSFSVN